MSFFWFPFLNSGETCYSLSRSTFLYPSELILHSFHCLAVIISFYSPVLVCAMGGLIAVMLSLGTPHSWISLSISMLSITPRCQRFFFLRGPFPGGFLVGFGFAFFCFLFSFFFFWVGSLVAFSYAQGTSGLDLYILGWYLFLF